MGAIWARLVPTVVALAFYFCLADAVLILQCLYYNHQFSSSLPPTSLAQADSSHDHTRPLLSREESNLGLPGSRRRSSTTSKPRWNTERDSVLFLPPIDRTISRPWFTNSASVVGVCLAGVGGWAIAWGIGLWIPVHEHSSRETQRGPVGAEAIGYLSAACYLGWVLNVQLVLEFCWSDAYSARIPQILKNYREKSCEGEQLLCLQLLNTIFMAGAGLSLLFFILSILGNATYGGGVS